jgi:hypothetical protein
MINSEQGRRLGDEVWREMLEVFEKEAPEIKRIIAEGS